MAAAQGRRASSSTKLGQEFRLDLFGREQASGGRAPLRSKALTRQKVPPDAKCVCLVAMAKDCAAPTSPTAFAKEVHRPLMVHPLPFGQPPAFKRAGCRLRPQRRSGIRRCNGGPSCRSWSVGARRRAFGVPVTKMRPWASPFFSAAAPGVAEMTSMETALTTETLSGAEAGVPPPPFERQPGLRAAADEAVSYARLYAVVRYFRLFSV